MWAGRLDGYFEYQDCKSSCRRLKLSCIITEASPTYFPDHCLDTDTVCEQMASRNAVCLRMNKKPLGGEEIWPDFQNYVHPTTTTTTISPPTTDLPTSTKAPTPDNKHECYPWRSMSLGASSVIGLLIAVKITQRLYHLRRQRAYQSIQNRSVDSVYQNTVEDEDDITA